MFMGQDEYDLSESDAEGMSEDEEDEPAAARTRVLDPDRILSRPAPPGGPASAPPPPGSDQALHPTETAPTPLAAGSEVKPKKLLVKRRPNRVEVSLCQHHAQHVLERCGVQVTAFFSVLLCSHYFGCISWCMPYFVPCCCLGLRNPLCVYQPIVYHVIV